MVYGKLVDKTLGDMTYSDVAELIYGYRYADDVARRMLYGSRKTLDMLADESQSSITDNDLLEELEAKRIELKKERQKFFDQRREFSKLVNSDGRREYLYEALRRSMSEIHSEVGYLFNDRIKPPSYRTENEAVVVFSDWHYGMVADNIFNKYDTNICKERVLRAVESIVERVELHGCETVHIAVLGDLFHGAIHTSARVASEELVCDQIMQVSEILAQAICEISKHVETTLVYMTYGNHGRTVQSKHDNIHRDNMERLVPWWLKERLSKCTGIEIIDDAEYEFISMDVAGHGFCAAHGDLDSVKGSTRLIPTLFKKKYGKDVDCILLGDKHHRESFNELGVTSVICGSLCGTDDYANDKRLYSEPSQLLIIVNPDIGIDAEYNIKL